MTNRALLLVALALLVAVAAQGRGWAQSPSASSTSPQFTTASLTGVCGFTLASTKVAASSGDFLEPRADVGTLSFNGLGAVTVNGTENKHGVVHSIGPEVGTYSVGSDGRTGTIDLTASGGPLFQFEIVSGGSELRFMSTGPVDLSTGVVDLLSLGICQF